MSRLVDRARAHARWRVRCKTTALEMLEHAMHVLVVDDEPAIAELVGDALAMHGFSVAVAHDGHEALRCVAERRPDIVLTDFMMPFVSGLELAAAMRREPETRALPIVLMSATSEPPPGERSLYDAFLAKPFGLKALLGALRKFTNGRVRE